MHEGMVKQNHCGTHAPIWLNGKYPQTKGDKVDLQACINLFDLNGGCFDSFDIGVKNRGNYFVYYLQPLFYCAVAYCAGKQLDEFRFGKLFRDDCLLVCSII